MTHAKKREPESLTDQGKKFISAARELGCDEDPEHFEAALKKVARHKPVESKPDKPEDNEKPSRSS